MGLLGQVVIWAMSMLSLLSQAAAALAAGLSALLDGLK